MFSGSHGLGHIWLHFLRHLFFFNGVMLVSPSFLLSTPYLHLLRWFSIHLCLTSKYQSGLSWTLYLLVGWLFFFFLKVTLSSLLVCNIISILMSPIFFYFIIPLSLFIKVTIIRHVIGMSPTEIIFPYHLPPLSLFLHFFKNRATSLSQLLRLKVQKLSLFIS